MQFGLDMNRNLIFVKSESGWGGVVVLLSASPFLGIWQQSILKYVMHECIYLWNDWARKKYVFQPEK